MFNFFSKLPNLEEFPLRTYSAQINLDRLVLGVDNIRHDVHLSPNFCKAAEKLANHLLNKHTDAEEILRLDKTSSLTRDIEEFRRICRDFLEGAVNKAKSVGEVQIDMLGQIAIVKMFSEEIQRQFKTLIENLNNALRKHEISRHQDLNKTVEIKEKLSEIQSKKNSILLIVGSELFQCLVEAQNEGLKVMREAVLGLESNLPDVVFLNPILYLENSFDDHFMIEQYVLLGHRFEDPDNYDALMFLIKNQLNKIISKNRSVAKGLERRGKTSDSDEEEGAGQHQVVRGNISILG